MSPAEQDVPPNSEVRADSVSPVVTQSRLPESLIPDCCNVGVIARALVTVNLVVAGYMYFTPDAIQGFLKASIFMEPTCLLSLLCLCATRRIMRSIGPWAQRAMSALIPAVITSAMSFAMSGSNLELTLLRPEQALFVGAVFGAALQHYFELRARALSPALSEARLQALQARIRPHFLFNSLNAVLSLVRSEPLRAENALEDLADLFRVLMRDARDVTSLEDEIRVCKKYLAIEKIRLGERLQVQWKANNISDRLLAKARVPSLVLQPLLENAVHYGVEPARTPVTITIELTRNIDELDIVITNPLPPEDQRGDAERGGNHMAIDNIKQRLRLLYDVEGGLSTESTQEQFVVRLRLPYVRGN